MNPEHPSPDSFKVPEDQETQSLDIEVTAVSPEDQKIGAQLQAAQQQISEHLRGMSKISDLTSDEAKILDKMKPLYVAAKQKEPDAPVRFKFTDKHEQDLYAQLVKKLILIAQSSETSSFSAMESKRKALTEQDMHDLHATAYAKYKSDPDSNIDIMLHPVDWKVGQEFDAHGIAKETLMKQLESLNAILEKGIDPGHPFHTAPLEVDPDVKAALGSGLGTGGGTAYKDGSFILLSEPGASLKSDGVKFVIVNDLYYEAINKLTTAYPDMEFIRADQAPDRLKAIVDQRAKR